VKLNFNFLHVNTCSKLEAKTKQMTVAFFCREFVTRCIYFTRLLIVVFSQRNREMRLADLQIPIFMCNSHPRPKEGTCGIKTFYF
jgi:ribulose 1,5-bisphosphate carboxylase large subunit-like protein